MQTGDGKAESRAGHKLISLEETLEHPFMQVGRNTTTRIFDRQFDMRFATHQRPAGIHCHIALGGKPHRIVHQQLHNTPQTRLVGLYRE